MFLKVLNLVNENGDWDRRVALLSKTNLVSNKKSKNLMFLISEINKKNR